MICPSARLWVNGFFDVHVFAGRTGIHRHGNVPVVGRANKHGVDIFTVEDFLVLFGGYRLGIG